MAFTHFLFVVAVVSALIACNGSGRTNGDVGPTKNDSGYTDADLCGDGSEFTLRKNALSSLIPTVGIVEWAMAGAPPAEAKIVFKLKDAASSLLNQGGVAPVDLNKSGYRTLLLGLKQAEDYTFHIEAKRDGKTCVSPEYALPTTGSYPDARPVTVEVTQATKREPGFIVTSSGTSVPACAFIIDADGDIVWYYDAPANPTRAQMDYEGNNMWMISLDLDNWNGEMRYVSMDGEQEQQNIEGLERSHHDFTVMPGGRVAALVWGTSGIDPASNLVIRSPDGALTTAFRVGSNLYQSDTFHANAIHYIPQDDSFTIADRNPSVFVKVSATGTAQWQLGGTCAGAPAGNLCFPEDWEVVHGHHWIEDGTFLAFNNTYTDTSHIFEFKVSATSTSFTVNTIKDYAGNGSSTTMGDVQRLPNGNTLITYSTDNKMVELDSTWNEVQTFSGRFGYSNWRTTLYGPPLRL